MNGDCDECDVMIVKCSEMSNDVGREERCDDGGRRVRRTGKRADY